MRLWGGISSSGPLSEANMISVFSGCPELLSGSPMEFFSCKEAPFPAYSENENRKTNRSKKYKRLMSQIISQD